MIQKDYIIRMIEQFAATLTKIIFNKETQNYAQALFEINASYKIFLNLDPDFIRAIPEDELVRMLKSNGRVDAEKCIVIAELLLEEVEIKELENDLNDAILSIYFKSFYLFVETLLTDSKFHRKEYLDKIAKIVEKIIKYELPNQTQFKLFQYYELTGRFGKAEDVLYELIDIKYEGILVEGKSFYERLLNRSDNELLNGNLPRDEVQEGLAQIKREISN